MSKFYDFKSMNNKSRMISRVYKDIILNSNNGFRIFPNFEKLVIEKLEDKYFVTNEEKLETANFMSKYLNRYFEYESSRNRKMIAKNIYKTININGQDIEIHIDSVFENASSIELVKYKASATELSYKARKAENLPENEIELYLMRELGKQLYHDYDKPIISSFYYMTGKYDNKDKSVYEEYFDNKTNNGARLYENLSILESNSLACTDKKEKKEIDKQIKIIKDVLYFNNSEGNNIITFKKEYGDLSKDVQVLLDKNSALTSESEKCKSYDCEMCTYSTICRYSKDDIKSKLKIVKEVQKSSTEVKLTDAQQKVVNVEEGNYRINSVAGSGKSTTMVMRTIELLKKGYKPSDILLITFTNKGCEELKEKIEYWLKVFNITSVHKKQLNIFTFNSFGEHIISKEWERLGFKQKPQLATLIDINEIIKELIEDEVKIEWLNYKNPLLNFPHAKGAFIQLKIYFDIIKSFDYTQEEFVEKVLNDKIDIKEKVERVKIIYGLYDKFNQKLKDRNLLQYQDQVLYLIELFKNNPDLLNYFGYSHVIVDEYQDTDFVQAKLLHILNDANTNKSLIVVGDNSQCLIEDTKILTQKGYIPIQDLNKDDVVICAKGHSEVINGKVDELIKNKYNGKIVKITTKSGKTLTGTPNHMIFMNIVPHYETFFVYLMYKKGLGYRVGRTRGVRAGERDKIRNGFEARIVGEGADKIWLIHQCDELKEAIFYESYYSYNYGIPQYVFDSKPHIKYNNMMDNDMIENLFSRIDTESRALKLLKDKNMFLEYPHYVPQASTTKTKRKIRYKLNFVMFGSNKERKEEPPRYYNELSFCTIHKEFADIAKPYMNTPIKSNSHGVKYYNGRKIGVDYDTLWDITKKIEKDCLDKNIEINISMKAKLTDEKIGFQPMINAVVGGIIPIIDDKRNVIIEDEIEKIEILNYNGNVYDINVNYYRNYIAEGICVHNCIYGFRNTTPYNMLNFHKEFTNVQDINLLENFRSTPQICNVANALDRLNTLRIDKDIISKKSDGKVPKLIEFDITRHENDYIVKLIKQQIEAGVPKHEICYIARTKKELLALQELLTYQNIPSVLDVSELYIENPTVQIIIGLANFFKNNEYDYYLLEYLNVLVDGLINMSKEEIIEIVAGFKNTLIEEFSQIESEEDKIVYFYNLLEKLINRDTIAREFINKLQKKTFYTLNELLSYLQKINLYKDNTSIEKDENKYDAVVLTTAHSSKGKEWKVVINSINSYKYEDIKDDNEALEEERRLLFVSITRAKEELYITYNTSQDKIKNKGKYCLFADELENVERIKVETKAE